MTLWKSLVKPKTKTSVLIIKAKKNSEIAFDLLLTQYPKRVQPNKK